MSLEKRRLNKIKELRWIEMRKDKRMTEARREQKQTKTSVRKKAQDKNQDLDKEREQ